MSPPKSIPIFAFQGFFGGESGQSENADKVNRLAWAEMKLIFAKVMWNFDLELAEDKNVGEWNDQKVYLINEKTPLYVRLRPRA